MELIPSAAVGVSRVPPLSGMQRRQSSKAYQQPKHSTIPPTFANMISFINATEKDAATIVNIGKVSVKEAHLGSCPEEILDEYLSNHYNNEAIKKELTDTNNVCSIITYNGVPAGFSKIVFNAPHAAINRTNTTKLRRCWC